MHFIFERKNEETGEVTKETVELERYIWGVIYKDGTVFKQFGDDGIFHQFREIEQDNVALFSVYRHDDNTKGVAIPVTDAMQIFHFYRQLMLDDGARRVKVYVFGWKDKETGATAYNYILPDDRVLTANHDLPDLTRYGI